MAVRRLAREQPDAFEFTPDNLAWAQGKIADYPQGRQASAVIPILWRAQEQHGGWLPEPAIRLVADMLGMPYIRVLEVATFYTMFQLQPVGTVAHVNVCGTTPCMLRGAHDLIAVCRSRIAAHPFETSADGRFSWEEVECAGACVNAPMVQIGPDTYEDLTVESFNRLLDALAAGERPAPGPQSARRGSEPITGPTTLTSPAHPTRRDAAAAGGDGAPDADVDPTSPAARDQKAARPVPRDRPDVEATRGRGGESGASSPVAPEPKTNGRLEHAPDAPAKQKSALAPGQTPDAAAGAPQRPADEPVAETIDPGKAAADRAEQADRAAPGATFAERAPAAHEASSTSTSGAGAPAAPTEPSSRAQDMGTAVPDAPDAVAAQRADAAGVRPPARTRAQVGEVDPLRRISGIGPVIEKTLHDLGIFQFEQIASWTDENKEWVNAYLTFKGRIGRERWVEQAQDLLAEKRGGER